MQQKQYKQLVERYLNGQATPEEQRLLEEHYTRMGRKAMGSLEDNEAMMAGTRIWNGLQDRIGAMGLYQQRPAMKKKKWWADVAITVLVVAAVSSILIMRDNKTEHPIAKADIKPGSNGAVLVAADGRKYVFNNNDGEQLSAQGGRIKLIHKIGETYIGSNVQGENVFSTARAKQYDIVLPDGSHAWLNAESSISYKKLDFAI